jgi:hypothetical protein
VRIIGKDRTHETFGEGNLYGGYKIDLMANVDGEEVQDLFVHSFSRERRMRKLAELKKAKANIMKLEQSMYHDHIKRTGMTFSDFCKQKEDDELRMKFFRQKAAE